MQREGFQRHLVSTLGIVTGIPFIAVVTAEIREIACRRSVLIRYSHLAACCFIPLVCHLVGVATVRCNGIAVVRRGLVGNSTGGKLKIAILIALNKVPLIRGNEVLRFSRQGTAACGRPSDYRIARYRNRCSLGGDKITRNAQRCLCGNIYSRIAVEICFVYELRIPGKR